jgi:hypothetical protein
MAKIDKPNILLAFVHQWLESFKEFPPRQKSASFTVDQIVES